MSASSACAPKVIVPRQQRLTVSPGGAERSIVHFPEMRLNSYRGLRYGTADDAATRVRIGGDVQFSNEMVTVGDRQSEVVCPP